MINSGCKETLCTKCAHSAVCALKTDFIAAQKTVDNLSVCLKCENVNQVKTARLCDISWIKPIELSCTNYLAIGCKIKEILNK